MGGLFEQPEAPKPTPPPAPKESTAPVFEGEPQLQTRDERARRRRTGKQSSLISLEDDAGTSVLGG